MDRNVEEGQAAGPAHERLDALQHRIDLEDLLTRLASAFIHRGVADFEAGIEAALADIAEFTHVDRVWLYRLHDARATVELVRCWVAPGVTSAARTGDVVHQDVIPRWMETLRRLETIYLAKLAGGDPWSAERRHLDAEGARSVLAVPLADEGRLVGFIGVDSVATYRVWSDEVLSVLQAAAGILSQALARGDAEQRFGLAFRHAPLGMAVHDASGHLVQVNQAFCDILGRPAEELVGLFAFDYILPDDHLMVMRASEPLQDGRSDLMVVETRYVVPDADPRWVRVHSAAVRSPDGLLRYSISHLEDITARRAQEAELAASEQRFRTLIENTPAVVVRFDRDLRMVFVSPALEELVGVPASELVGRRATESRGSLDLGVWEASIRRVFDTGGRHDAEWELPFAGDTLWFQSRAVPEFGDDGAVEHVLVLSTDITALKRSEAELAHQALHDPLTGLANRALLRDHLQLALDRHRPRPEGLAVLFCDLDRFKLVNDSMGHQVGDALLSVVARRLASLTRPGDTVARLGGDEFVVVLERCDDVTPVLVADRIRDVLSDPVEVEGTEVFTTVSIGIALGSTEIDADGLLRDADAAMYLAKARGRDRYEIFDEALRERATERLQLESALRRSVEAGELVVYYQPEVALEEGVVVGAEALARWHHPDHGLLEAGRFIELAEETGLITELGAWVLAQACRQAGRWIAEHPDREFTMRVNLSARQLTQPDLAEVVRRAVAQGPIDPARLCLEITETALMDDPVEALAVLTELHGLGVTLAVDDFGTGYSSLAYLKRFPVDVLKIDRSFVDGLGTDPEDTAIAAAIVGLSRALGMRVVAEGVETPLQLDELRRLGCDSAQGYLLARPGPPDVFWAADGGVVGIAQA